MKDILSSLQAESPRKKRDKEAKAIMDNFMKGEFGTLYDYAGMYRLCARMIAITERRYMHWEKLDDILKESALISENYQNGIFYEITPLGEKFREAVDELNKNI
jgi:hypothetical protein